MIFLLAAGIWLAQAIYRAYVKPVSQGEQGGPPRPAPARGPPKDIRDFLAEIRGEARSETEPGSPEVATSRPPQPASHGESPEETASRPQRTESDRRGPRPVRERPSRPSPASPAFPAREVRPPPAPEVDPVTAPGSVHAYFENLTRQEADVRAKQVAKKERTRQRMARATGSLRADGGPRTPIIPSLGLSLRDAVLAQVILGPPRCRGRQYRRK